MAWLMSSMIYDTNIAVHCQIFRMLCSYHCCTNGRNISSKPRYKNISEFSVKGKKMHGLFSPFLIMCAFPLSLSLHDSCGYMDEFLYEIHFCIIYCSPNTPTKRAVFVDQSKDLSCTVLFSYIPAWLG